MLIDNILPAIRAVWPRGSIQDIIQCQQDNAKPHIDPWDQEFLDAASIDGFHIRLRQRPPNSPDLNVLDSGFFNAIQSLQHQHAPKTVDELIQAVQITFNDFTREKLNNVFFTLQQCMVCDGKRWRQQLQDPAHV